VIEAGPADGPPVILLHGFPEFSYGWRNQAPALAEAGLRVLAPDLRGHNLSSKPGGLSAYRMDRIAGDVIGLMDTLGYPKASLVGHDWGGVIAWVTAVLHPQRVEKLAVLNAPYPLVAFRTLLRRPIQLIKSGYMYFFQLPWLPEAVLRRKNWQLMVRGMENSSHSGAFQASDFEQYRQAWAQPGAITGMLNWYRAFFRRPVNLPLKPALNMPVLLLWGAQDVALDRELAEASIRLCTDGRLIYFEHASHWLQHEEPEVVNQLLVEFLHHPGSPHQSPAEGEQDN
jgi:pimeloyl-ACP methyl ester carboxylesterase